MRIFIALVLSFMVFTQAGISTTINVPDDHPTIQEAIDAAEPGDTILVGPGTYLENIDFKGKGIIVISTAGPVLTVIDGGSPDDPDYGSVVSFISKEGEDTLLQGFTLTNGTGNLTTGLYRGGGVYCHESHPTLVNNHITNNEADMGAGIYCKYFSSPTIIDCAVYENTASQEGGGMRTYGSHPVLANSTIYNNSAMEGGGINCKGASPGPCLINVTLWGNTALGGGGGIYSRYDCALSVTNCIIFGNIAAQGSQIYIAHSTEPTPATISYSDVQGGEAAVFLHSTATLNWGAGNIDAEPQFVDTGLGDFHLTQGSPCIDKGDNDPVHLETDFEGEERIFNHVVDMGADEFNVYPLASDALTISASTGGVVHFTLTAGASNESRNYIILGSVSGTSPGTPLPGGHAVLPLNWDPFTKALMPLINSALLQNFMGKLDEEGNGAATLNVPEPVPEGLGLTLFFAYALNSPWDYTSNPVAIEVVP